MTWIALTLSFKRGLYWLESTNTGIIHSKPSSDLVRKGNSSDEKIPSADIYIIINQWLFCILPRWSDTSKGQRIAMNFCNHNSDVDQSVRISVMSGYENRISGRMKYICTNRERNYSNSSYLLDFNRTVIFLNVSKQQISTLQDFSQKPNQIIVEDML